MSIFSATLPLALKGWKFPVPHAQKGQKLLAQGFALWASLYDSIGESVPFAAIRTVPITPLRLVPIQRYRQLITLYYLIQRENLLYCKAYFCFKRK